MQVAIAWARAYRSVAPERRIVRFATAFAAQLCRLRSFRRRRGGVGELAEQTGDDEHDLLGDIHRVIADPLQAARHQNHEHGPLPDVEIVADLDGALEDLAVEP